MQTDSQGFLGLVKMIDTDLNGGYRPVVLGTLVKLIRIVLPIQIAND